MRRLAIEFYRYEKFLVEVVQVACPAAERDPRLPLCNRQPMGALDSSHVPVFENGVHSGAGLCEGPRQLSSPAQPAPGLQGHAQQVRRGEPAAARPADPGERGLGVGGDLRQVERGLLDPGARRSSGGVAGGVNPARTVDDDAGSQVAALMGTHRQLPGGVDGHMDQAGRTIGEPVQLGGGVVAERRARSSAQNGRPQHCLTGRVTSERRVDTPVERPPAATPERAVDDAGIQADGRCLPACQDATLKLEQFPAVVREVWGHVIERGRAASARSSRPAACA